MCQWSQLMCQDSPVRGLWLCTVWASAASVDPAVTAMEGVPTVLSYCVGRRMLWSSMHSWDLMGMAGGVGMIATFGGLVLLAVLLTTISDRLQTIRWRWESNSCKWHGKYLNNVLSCFIYPNRGVGCPPTNRTQNTWECFEKMSARYLDFHGKLDSNI